MKKSHIAMLADFFIVLPLTISFGMHLPGRSYYITSTLVIVELLVPFLLAFESRKPQARELVGAYTPWQMFAYGAGGMLAGFLFAKNRLPKKPVVMGVFGFLAVLLFVGPLLDTCTVFLTLPVINAQTAWPLYVSGFPVNLSQGLCTLLTMLLFGKPLLEKLDRVKLQYGMGEDDGV